MPGLAPSQYRELVLGRRTRVVIIGRKLRAAKALVKAERSHVSARASQALEAESSEAWGQPTCTALLPMWTRVAQGSGPPARGSAAAPGRAPVRGGSGGEGVVESRETWLRLSFLVVRLLSFGQAVSCYTGPGSPTSATVPAAPSLDACPCGPCKRTPGTPRSRCTRPRTPDGKAWKAMWGSVIQWRRRRWAIQTPGGRLPMQRGTAFDAAGGRHPELVQHRELRALSSGEAFDGVE